MKQRELVHPRKVVWAMRDFLNNASDLMCEYTEYPSQQDYLAMGGDPNNILGFLDYGKEVREKRKCILKKAKGFRAYFTDENYPTFLIGYNLEELYSQGSKQFRQDFIERCPMAKGFANITLTLLHELGHLSTEQDFEDFDREIAMLMIGLLPKEKQNLMYFRMPDEENATDWAIEWLQSAENRKLAKAFEKKFFACFE